MKLTTIKNIRQKKYKTDYVMANNDTPEVEQKEVLEYTKRIYNEKTESYEYITETINYKNDWENTMQLLEANEDLISKKKVRI